MEELKEKLALLTENALQKIIISKPAGKASEIRKIVIEQKKAYYQAARYTEKQVFHDNVEKEALATYLYEKMVHDFYS